jgi:hypothetical protein
MKNFLGTMTVAAILAVAATLPARAEVGTIDFGITNSIANNYTTTVNLGNAVAITGQDRGGLMLSMTGSQAGTGLVTITFARSPDNVNWETTPRFTWAAALNGTTPVVACTNLDQTVVGAFGYLKVVSIVNADASCLGTAASLKLVKKTIKASP